MRCSMLKDINRGAIVKGGIVVTRKCIRTENSNTRAVDIQETKIFERRSVLNRQHCCTTLPFENEGNREPDITRYY